METAAGARCWRRRRAARRPALLAAAAFVTLAVGLLWPAAPAPRAQDKPVKKGIPEATQRGEIDASRRARPAGMPRDIGEILEVTDAARQTGLGSVRLLRRGSNTLYDWLHHLRISIAEHSLSDIAYDRENCQLLFEVVQQSSPSRTLHACIGSLRQEMDLGERGDPTAAFLRLQLAIEKYRQLYPLQDLDPMAAMVMTLYRDGKTQPCEEALDVLVAATAQPNLDGPVQRSLAIFQSAMDALDRNNRSEARSLLRDSASYISHMNVGSFLAEANWYLSKTDLALQQGLSALAVASLRDVDTVLGAAQDRAWKEFRPLVRAVREDARTLLEKFEDTKKKGALTESEIRSIARRIEAELRIPA